LLAELNLSSYLPLFEQESISFNDLLILNQDELVQLIPQMGPRRRLIERAREIAQQRDHQQLQAALAAQQQKIIDKQKQLQQETDKAQQLLAQQQHEEILIQRDRDRKAIAPRKAAPLVAVSTTPTATLPVMLIPPHTRNTSAPLVPSALAGMPANAAIHAVHALHAQGLPGAHAATVAAVQALAHTQSGSLNSADLQREYERGKSETLEAAKERLQQIREQYTSRVKELEQKISADTAQRDQQMVKVRELVTKLRDDLAREKDEKDQIIAKSRQQAQDREGKKDANIKMVKAVMDRVYTTVSSEVKNVEFCESATVLAMVKRTLVSTTAAFIKSPDSFHGS